MKVEHYHYIRAMLERAEEAGDEQAAEVMQSFLMDCGGVDAANAADRTVAEYMTILNKPGELDGCDTEAALMLRISMLASFTRASDIEVTRRALDVIRRSTLAKTRGTLLKAAASHTRTVPVERVPSGQGVAS